ncbi:class I SAM-dependent methyltransferase [Miltoncostaea marina]|uniref:class I SAM-dependent methyltransferase n=1 Tax=Miltoncostaea marina TaxID=2843215 RepID=UPI001C3D4C9B|nr:class I SAM-dependent methyltransferase [Miltoncostaea marina]
MTTTTFDPVAVKATTREQWQEAADAWHRWGPAIERWLGEATEVMLDMAEVGPGDRVLDVAAGAGGQSLVAARRVGPTGRVLATDISGNILEHAAASARAAGLANVETAVMDGEDLSAVEQASFDAAISRVGLIYFPDQAAALAGIRRALRPGGTVAVIVYGPPERNGFFSMPVGVIRRRAQLPAPLPGQPGPFSLGAPGVVEKALASAGFREVRTRVVPSPVRMASAQECLRFERESFGALHQMLAGLDEAAREAAWDEVGEALAAFEGPEGFVGPCEMIVAAGTR